MTLRFRARRFALVSAFGAALVWAAALSACNDDTGTATATHGSTGTGGAMTSSASSTSGAGGAHANVDGLITSANIYVNCMPGAEADPVHGMFTASYVNSGEATGSLDVESVSVAFTSGTKKLDWSFAVTPTTSGDVAPGATIPVMHTKVDGSGKGSDASLNPCDFCSGTASLTLNWKENNLKKTGSKTLGLVQCAQ